MANTEPPQWPSKIEVEITGAEVTPDQPSIAQVLARTIAPLLALGGAVGVLLLSFGWSYAWHWFESVGIPFVSLVLGPDTLLEYGRLVVIQFWWQALLWIAVVAAGVLAIHTTLRRPALIVFLLGAGFLLPWFASDKLGDATANAEYSEQRAERFGGWPEVHVLLSSDSAKVFPERVLAELSNGPHLCYRLMFRATDGLWLARMSGNGLPGAVVFLPAESIEYLRLRRPSGGDC